MEEDSHYGEENQNLHRLLEALYYDDINDKFWWDLLGSVEKAKDIVAKAYKDKPNQTQLDFLVEILELDTCKGSKTDIYNRCLNELRRELIQVES